MPLNELSTIKCDDFYNMLSLHCDLLNKPSSFMALIQIMLLFIFEVSIALDLPIHFQKNQTLHLDGFDEKYTLLNEL